MPTVTQRRLPLGAALVALALPACAPGDVPATPAASPATGHERLEFRVHRLRRHDAPVARAARVPAPPMTTAPLRKPATAPAAEPLPPTPTFSPPPVAPATEERVAEGGAGPGLAWAGLLSGAALLAGLAVGAFRGVRR
jgi:hypothetical protein